MHAVREDVVVKTCSSCIEVKSILLAATDTRVHCLNRLAKAFDLAVEILKYVRVCRRPYLAC